MTQSDYRRSCKIYHYSIGKPWDGGRSGDPDFQLWDSYSAAAAAMTEDA